MSRLERPTPKSSNPAKKFLEWKSEKECFSYYDREKSENIDVNLPIKILFIEHYHTVKGWHDASESKIYSNEVYSIGSKELTVKSYKGGELAKGLYKNIKDKIKSFGGRYYRSIYVMLDDGELINIQLKGAAVKDYSDFYQEKNHLLDNQWIVIKDVKKEKKGRIEYTVPVFSLGDTITRAEDKKAMEVSRLMQNYVDSYNAKNIEVEDLIEVEKGDDSDPLDF